MSAPKLLEGHRTTTLRLQLEDFQTSGAASDRAIGQNRAGGATTVGVIADPQQARGRRPEHDVAARPGQESVHPAAGRPRGELRQIDAAVLLLQLARLRRLRFLLSDATGGVAREALK